MYSIIDPTSGEKGFFCSESEKVLIDAILVDFSNKNSLVVQDTSSDARGVEK